MFCPKCGTENSTQTRFCRNCGFNLKTIVIEHPIQPTQIPAPVQAVPVTVQYAGFWLRLVADLIDTIIFWIINYFIDLAAGFQPLGRNDEIQYIIWVFLWGTIVNWLYYALMESFGTQATLGKMALGLKVTDLNGNRISFSRATGRHFAKWLSVLIFSIGFFMIAFTEKKQGLHDMIAGTLVVKK